MNMEAITLTAFPAIIIMASREHLLQGRIKCVIICGQKFVQLAHALPDNSPSKQSQSCDGILSHHDVILCNIPLIEVTTFACTLRKQVAHTAYAHHKFRPNELP